MEVSIFRNFWDKVPVSSTLEAMVEAIRTDVRTRELTEGYRLYHLGSLKDESMMFAVPCVFEGGKAQKHVVRLTGISMVDFDHADQLTIENGKLKIIADPHTLMCYTTISGEGLRVLYRYELDNQYDLKQQIQYYSKAFAAGNAYYENLTGAKADEKCKNVTRLSGLAHDETVYYNPDAEAFPAEWIEAEWAKVQGLQKEDRKRKRELARIGRVYERTIRPEVESEGAVYAAGSHNDYVMRVGYRLNQFGFSQAAATEWAVREFADYELTAAVIASCYQKEEEHGSRGGQIYCRGQDPTAGRYASVAEIQEFLRGHIQLRHNVITGRVEHAPDWQPISDRVVNSLWAEMSKAGRVNVQDIYRVIESDFVEEFHPFKAYLDSLSPPTTQTDHIGELAGTVRVKGGTDKQELFCRYLRKWLVGMVAGWVDDTVVNNVVLVLIGEQGSYKTTWFNYLLPPELSAYFYTKTNANRMGRDDLLTLALYGLVCCEELDTMRPAELNQLKAAVTMRSIDERAAYAHFHEHRKHIASLCGTGNNVQFLSDPTGNRRWLPFEIEDIQSPREHPLNYEGIYSQAYRLYRSGFQYWFSREEILQLSEHNREYETPRLELELVQLYFRKPGEKEGGMFMSVGRALQIVSSNVAQKLSSVYMGRAFSELGFRSVKCGGQRGYIVVQRTAEEILAIQRAMAAQAIEEDMGQ
ncbi:MAG: virulence protein E [Bacteroidaceae bacterium]|nr:virulence protein E [Bacteroidaceae bacterium]